MSRLPYAVAVDEKLDDHRSWYDRLVVLLDGPVAESLAERFKTVPAKIQKWLRDVQYIILTDKPYTALWDGNERMLRLRPDVIEGQKAEILLHELEHRIQDEQDIIDWDTLEEHLPHDRLAEWGAYIAQVRHQLGQGEDRSSILKKLPSSMGLRAKELILELAEDVEPQSVVSSLEISGDSVSDHLWNSVPLGDGLPPVHLGKTIGIPDIFVKFVRKVFEDFVVPSTMQRFGLDAKEARSVFSDLWIGIADLTPGFNAGMTSDNRMIIGPNYLSKIIQGDKTLEDLGQTIVHELEHWIQERLMNSGDIELQEQGYSGGIDRQDQKALWNLWMGSAQEQSAEISAIRARLDAGATPEQIRSNYAPAFHPWLDWLFTIIESADPQSIVASRTDDWLITECNANHYKKPDWPPLDTEVDGYRFNSKEISEPRWVNAWISPSGKFFPMVDSVGGYRINHEDFSDPMGTMDQVEDRGWIRFVASTESTRAVLDLHHAPNAAQLPILETLFFLSPVKIMAFGMGDEDGCFTTVSELTESDLEGGSFEDGMARVLSGDSVAHLEKLRQRSLHDRTKGDPDMAVESMLQRETRSTVEQGDDALRRGDAKKAWLEKKAELVEVVVNNPGESKSGVCVICALMEGQPVSEAGYPPFHPHCYPADTEVLTDSGWKFWPAVSGDEKFLSINLDDGNAEWVKAKQLIAVDYTGPLRRYQNHNLEFLVTPNHFQVVMFGKELNSKGRLDAGIWQLIEDRKLPKSNWSFLATIPNWVGRSERKIVVAGETFDTLDFVRFVAIYLSEGCAAPARRRSQPQLCISQMKHQKLFWDLCARIFGKIWPGKHACYIPMGDKPALFQWFQDFGKSWEKFIPKEIKELKKEYLEEFLNYYTLGDGNEKQNVPLPGAKTLSVSRQIATSSSRMAADLGELILKIGKRPSYSLDKARWIQHKNGLYLTKHPCWRVNVCTGTKHSDRNMTIDWVDYTGKIYDVELEKFHTLVIRRKNGVIVSGNCACSTQEIQMSTQPADVIDELDFGLDPMEPGEMEPAREEGGVEPL